MTETATLILNAIPDHLRLALLPWESVEDLESLFQDYQQAYRPNGPAEAGLVEQLVWLDWRRRRLRLGERALHMASLDRSTSSSRYDQLSRRALLLEQVTRPDVSSSGAIRSNDEADRGSRTEWAGYLSAAVKAKKILEEQGADGFQRAFNALPEGTQEWFDELVEEDEARFPRNAEGLQLFLTLEVMPYFKSSHDGAGAGPAIRLQAWGESLEPERADKLVALDERLTRQYEKALGMLLKLQEIQRQVATKRS